MRSSQNNPNTRSLTNSGKNRNRLYNREVKWLPSSPGLASNGQPLHLRLNKCNIGSRGPIQGFAIEATKNGGGTAARIGSYDSTVLPKASYGSATSDSDFY